MSTEPTHFLTLMNNGKTFSSLDGVVCSYSALTSFSFYQGTDKPRYWISWALKYPANLFNNDLDNTRNNMKSQIQKKKGGISGITSINIKQNY